MGATRRAIRAGIRGLTIHGRQPFAASTRKANNLRQRLMKLHAASVVCSNYDCQAWPWAQNKYNYFASTISLPRSIFMPQVKVNSPDLLGVNSTAVLLKGGRFLLTPKSPKTTCSLQDEVSSR